MKVYIVTDGEYSDKRIEGVFDDLKKAEIFCATLDSDEAVIDEYDTESIQIESNEEPKVLWIATVFEKGIRLERVRLTLMNRNSISYERGWIENTYKVIATLPKDTPEEKVKKIIYDRVAEYKARQEGVV